MSISLLHVCFAFTLAICMPSCKNNGICISPGKCSCAENFVGPYCEQEKKLCLTRPPHPHNSRLSCSSTDCTIQCAKGYQFPDGSSITNMICKEGHWQPSRADQTSIPDCKRNDFHFHSLFHISMIFISFLNFYY